MRRRDFTIGVLLATATRAQAQQPAKSHRIAIIVSAGPATRVNEPASRWWQAFWEELSRLGDVEGQNLTVERYSGEGRPEGFADLAREVVRGNPEVIVAIGAPITSAVTAASGTIPIVASGTFTSSGVLPNLGRPGGNMTGVRVEEAAICGKRLQILKQAVPSASQGRTPGHTRALGKYHRATGSGRASTGEPAAGNLTERCVGRGVDTL
jgi:putative tryptophan/tyrosine transport system substrate-binding protein